MRSLRSLFSLTAFFLSVIILFYPVLLPAAGQHQPDHQQQLQNDEYFVGAWVITTRTSDGTQFHRRIQVHPNGIWEDDTGGGGHWHRTSQQHITFMGETHDDQGRHSNETISVDMVDEDRSVSVGTWIVLIMTPGENGEVHTESHTYHILFEPETSNMWDCFESRFDQHRQRMQQHRQSRWPQFQSLFDQFRATPKPTQ